MPLRIRCPACQTMLQVADANRGQRVRCPKCNGIMQVPAPPAPTPVPTPGPPPMAIPVAASGTAAPPAIPISVMKEIPPTGIKPMSGMAEMAVRSGVETSPAPAESSGDLEEFTTPLHRLHKSPPKQKSGQAVVWLQAAVNQAKRRPWIAGGAGALVLILLGTWLIFRSPAPSDTARVARRGKEPAPVKTQPPPVPVVEAPPEPPVPPEVEVPNVPPPPQISPEAIQKVKKATVYIKVTHGNGMAGEGSGFFAVEPGLILTNAHVVGMMLESSPGPKDLEVVLNSGQGPKEECVLQAAVKGVDRESDLAVLQVMHQQERWPEPLLVGSSLSLTDLQKLYVFGFPGGYKVSKAVTPTEALFSVLHKRDGKPSQIQVQGAMWHGNSGGPVVDSRGVVVGVAVAGIPSTQIHFAIPADHVLSLRRGRVTRVGFGEPFRDSASVKLPVELDCLDPLERIRDLKLSVWVGNPGPARLGSAASPAPAKGDGPRQEFEVKYQDGKAETAEVALPTSAWDYGKVVWVQPVLTSAGKPYWSEAIPYKISAFDPLELKPALLQYKFDGQPERVVKVRVESRIQEVRAAAVPDAEEKREIDALETVHPDADGGTCHLQIRSGKGSSGAGPHTKEFSPGIEKLIQGKAFDYKIDATGKLLKSVKAEALKAGQDPAREEAGYLMKDIANAVELACLPIAGKEMRPKETWECRLRCHIPLTAFRGQTKSDVLEVHATCTALGTRMNQKQREAQIAMKGTLWDRSGNMHTGHFSGNVHFSVDKGYVTLADMRVEVEATTNGGLARLTSEVSVTRSARK